MVFSVVPLVNIVLFGESLNYARRTMSRFPFHSFCLIRHTMILYNEKDTMRQRRLLCSDLIAYSSLKGHPLFFQLVSQTCHHFHNLLVQQPRKPPLAKTYQSINETRRDGTRDRTPGQTSKKGDWHHQEMENCTQESAPQGLTKFCKRLLSQWIHSASGELPAFRQLDS